jgi:DNA-binding NarL/FixJ family response regulator
MTVSRFLPIIIPGILIQLIVQAYYIRHALRNNDLTKARRRTFALAIAVLNLPAAVVYLFSNRSKEEKMTNDFEGVDVDPNIRQGIFVMLVIAFEIFSLRIIADNVDNPYRGLLVGLLAYCFVIMIINNLFIDQSSGILYHLVPMTLIIMAIPIEYLDNSYFAQFIALLVTASIINRLPFKHARPYTIGAFCAFWIGGAAKALRFNGLGGMDEIISYMYINALIFILVIGAFYTLKRQLLTNNQLNAALVRVLLADDQRIILDGLRALLEMDPHISVVDMAENGESAYEKTLKVRPDVVLMDIRMPKMDGVEATRLIKRDSPETVVIMLTTFDDDDYIIKAMTYGASGYLLKDIGSDRLIQAIMDGVGGSIILPGNVAAKITSRLKDEAACGDPAVDFTQRELDIIIPDDGGNDQQGDI